MEYQKNLLKHYNLELENVKPMSEFHKTFFKFLKRGNIYTRTFDKLIRHAEESHKQTWIIPEAYFRSWLGQSPERRSMSKLSKETKRYGSIWLDLHLLTLFLNASSRNEIIALCTKLGATPTMHLASIGVQYHLQNFGRCLIIPGMIYFPNLHLLQTVHYSV